MSSEQTQKFKKSYEALKNTATAMQGDIDDIDEILEHVKAGVANYQICRARLDFVQKELDKLLENSDLPPNPLENVNNNSLPSISHTTVSKDKSKNGEEFDDDIPF